MYLRNTNRVGLRADAKLGIVSTIKANVKNTILLLLLLLFSSNVVAEDIDITRIIQIESSGNPAAYNKRSKAIGLCQIRSCVLADWNRLHPRETYLTVELYKPEVNKKIGSWYINKQIPIYLKYYKIPDTTKNRLIAYNFGIGNLMKYLRGDRKLPKETRDYIKKYKGEIR